MAQGTLTVFEEFSKYIADGSHDMDTDVFNVALITTLPTAADVTPDLADYTEVSGGTSYTAGGAALTTTWTEVDGVTSFKVTNSPITWAKDASGPTDIVAALIYNTNHVGTNDAVAFIDMTTDAGVTPVSLQNGDISITFNAAGIFTLTA